MNLIDKECLGRYTQTCVKILVSYPMKGLYTGFSRFRSNRKDSRISTRIFGGLSRIFRRWRELLHRSNTRIHHLQRKGVVYLKQHKTVRVLHLFRQYSALTVVISSAFVVTGTNIASREQSDSPLSGYFHANDGSKESPASSSEKNQSISSAPLAIATSAVDTEAKIDDPSEVAPPSNSIIASSDLAPVIQEDPEEGDGVKIYTVQDGDTLGKIAKDHNITINTILWANDIDNVDEIRPGDQIFILPVAGLKYIVKDGDTIQDIAKKYHGNADRIIAFNNLPANGRLETDQEIIIPDGYKDMPKPAPSESLLDRRQYATSNGGSATDISGWRTLDGKAGSGHSFPYGYCTWYVAQKRYVPWGGNAGTWIYNAKSLGYRTGRSPQVGSIVVTTENRYYGHVALVEKVLDDAIIVSEMNYAAWGKTDRRTLPISSRSIKGYIY